MVNNMTNLECFIVDNEDIADVYMADARYCSNPERKAMYIKAAEKHRQIAKLLRELQERRKAPEIVRCKECKLNKTPLCVMSFQQECEWNEDDNYCSWAERRTDDKH